MENASKALLMAGGVLIALLIIGALLLMFNNLSSYQKVGEQDTKEAQVIEFNNQFETYNRKNVRGSELYSLLNRVVDYNRRKSTEGVGNDQGQYVAYANMKIKVDLGSDLKKYTPDDTVRLLNNATKNGVIEQSATSNDFKIAISNTINLLESKYGAESLNKLVGGLSKIFIDFENTNITDKEKDAAKRAFNQASKKVSVNDWNQLKKDSEIRKDVYTYYEYVQFKRARFDCEKTEYDKQSGRIINMEFKFTGKFE